MGSTFRDHPTVQSHRNTGALQVCPEDSGKIKHTWRTDANLSRKTSFLWDSQGTLLILSPICFITWRQVTSRTTTLQVGKERQREGEEQKQMALSITSTNQTSSICLFLSASLIVLQETLDKRKIFLSILTYPEGHWQGAGRLWFPQRGATGFRASSCGKPGRHRSLPVITDLLPPPRGHAESARASSKLHFPAL